MMKTLRGCFGKMEKSLEYERGFKEGFLKAQEIYSEEIIKLTQTKHIPPIIVSTEGLSEKEIKKLKDFLVSQEHS